MLLGLRPGLSLTRLAGPFRLGDQIRHPIDFLKAVHTQAIYITAADVFQGLPAQDDMNAITFHDVVVPAFKFAMAMGTNFRHRNCFTPNIITSVDLAADDEVDGPMKRI
jgi:hypothetical protein